MMTIKLGCNLKARQQTVSLEWLHEETGLMHGQYYYQLPLNWCGAASKTQHRSGATQFSQSYGDSGCSGQLPGPSIGVPADLQHAGGQHWRRGGKSRNIAQVVDAGGAPALDHDPCHHRRLHHLQIVPARSMHDGRKVGGEGVCSAPLGVGGERSVPGKLGFSCGSPEGVDAGGDAGGGGTVEPDVDDLLPQAGRRHGRGDAARHGRVVTGRGGRGEACTRPFRFNAHRQAARSVRMCRGLAVNGGTVLATASCQKTMRRGRAGFDRHCMQLMRSHSRTR